MSGQRRPIPSRGTAWAGRAMRALDRRGVRPNQVSAAGLLAALAAGGALAAAPSAGEAGRAALLLAVPALIGLRLLANMLDGMLAVEAGRGTPDGPLWNELPDRLADIAVLVGAGHGAGLPALGWAAAVAALAPAHVRAVGDALDLPGGFAGPMGKPQRMVAMALASGAAALAGPAPALGIGLWAVIAGSVLTAGRRTLRLRRALRQRAGGPVSPPPSPGRPGPGSAGPP